MDRARVDTVGRMLSGQHPGWFVYVVHDEVDTGGYFIIKNAARDFSSGDEFDDWLADLEGVQAQFEYWNLDVEWLDDPAPSFANRFAKPS